MAGEHGILLYDMKYMVQIIIKFKPFTRCIFEANGACQVFLLCLVDGGCSLFGKAVLHAKLQSHCLSVC